MAADPPEAGQWNAGPQDMEDAGGPWAQSQAPAYGAQFPPAPVQPAPVQQAPVQPGRFHAWQLRVTRPQPVSGQPPPGRGTPEPGRPRPGLPGQPGVPGQAGATDQAGGVVALLPYLAVLLCTVVGVYVAWSLGSAGGGTGGVIIGCTLLAAAAARLALPARLAVLLANRKRATDVLTLTIFGAGLLIAGLVLPR
jgi:hypothetical protein